jgi:hypothetical protein
MKCRNHSLAFLTMCLLASAALTGGCATTGMQRSVKASHSISDVDNEVREMIVQIDATAASLDAVVNPGQTELKKSFNSYSDNLNDLDKKGARVLKRSKEMSANSKEYFAEWEKQGKDYTNPQLRELSEERRNKLAGIYAQVPAASAGVKETYLAYLTDLKDIQKYLSNDLTSEGIKSVTPIAHKSVQDLDSLKTSLRPVVYALDEIKAELYSGKK